MLRWENTDQFGNLKVATSSATSFDDIEGDLVELVDAVIAQHQENVKFSVDVPYGEISAPGGDRVSHVLAVPFVAELLAMGDSEASLTESLSNRLAKIVGDRGKVVGPW